MAEGWAEAKEVERGEGKNCERGPAALVVRRQRHHGQQRRLSQKANGCLATALGKRKEWAVADALAGAAELGGGVLFRELSSGLPFPLRAIGPFPVQDPSLCRVGKEHVSR